LEGLGVGGRGRVVGVGGVVVVGFVVGFVVVIGVVVVERGGGRIGSGSGGHDGGGGEAALGEVFVRACDFEKDFGGLEPEVGEVGVEGFDSGERVLSWSGHAGVWRTAWEGQAGAGVWTATSAQGRAIRSVF
jgi:hypothetical protein